MGGWARPGSLRNVRLRLESLCLLRLGETVRSRFFLGFVLRTYMPTWCADHRCWCPRS
jgi:hypothetical protein